MDDLASVWVPDAHMPSREPEAVLLPERSQSLRQKGVPRLQGSGVEQGTDHLAQHRGLAGLRGMPRMAEHTGSLVRFARVGNYRIKACCS